MVASPLGAASPCGNHSAPINGRPTMISDRLELGDAALDGQISDLAASCVEADRLQSLIRPLAERCDRLARSWLDHPTPLLGFGLSQASQCLHQALINLEGVTESQEPSMTTARSAGRSCANDPSPAEAKALPYQSTSACRHPGCDLRL